MGKHLFGTLTIHLMMIMLGEAQSMDDFGDVLNSTFNNAELKGQLLTQIGDSRDHGYIYLNRKLLNQMRAIGYVLPKTNYSDTILLCQRSATRIYLFVDFKHFTNKIEKYLTFESLSVSGNCIRLKFNTKSLNFVSERVVRPNIAGSITFTRQKNEWKLVKLNVRDTKPTLRLPY